jgi:hypothetical protein
MEELQFPADVNPFGISYNPSSVSRNLWTLMEGKEYAKEDLHSLEGKWFSYDHHGRFSSPDAQTCLDAINSRIGSTRKRLKDITTLIITWGTARVWVHKKTTNVVNNCHKVPANQFQRYLLSVTQVVDTYTKLFARIRQDIPGLKVILTVSPVRHWKDGAQRNNVSKSTLILAAHRLCQDFSYCEYFPSFEIAMDDLRDYRYYADDLLHPNRQMVDYIWEKFSDAYFDAETRQITASIQKIVTARQHRPFDPGSGKYLEFCRKQIDIITKLKQKNPFLDLKGLEQYFTEQLDQ